MKKAIVVLMAVVMTAAMGLTAFAADFVPSIEAKTIKIIPIEFMDELFGALKILDQDGEPTEGVPLFDKDGVISLLEFYVLPASEKEKALLTQIKDDITNAQNQIKAAADLGKLTDGLDKELQKKIDEYYGDSDEKIGVGDLIVYDLFDAGLIRDKKVLEQIENGKSVRFIVDPGIPKNDFFVLLHNVGGNHWETVNDVQWTEDGYLMITVNKLDVFAFAVARNADLPIETDDPGSPQTGSGAGMNFLYAGIAVLCVGAAVAFFVQAKKKRTAA